MTPGTRLAVGLGTAAAAAAVGVWARTLWLRWRRRDAAEVERLRRSSVNRHGRITTGRILDVTESDDSEPALTLVQYRYEVAGVTYEAAQDVTRLRNILRRAQCLAGQTVSVKYDTKRPTNSIIVCEEWNGLPGEGNAE